MIEDFKSDILLVYNWMVDKGKLGKSGYPEHDFFQKCLTLLAKKYNLTYVTEYRGKLFYDYEKDRKYRGRIDIVYYKDGEPYISLEIDCGLKGTSIKKLLANNEFKYKIWFCYNRKSGTKEYYDLINKIDKDKEIMYLIENRHRRNLK